MEITYSVKDVPIRLSYERWFHITENHDELASYYFEVLETVEKPDFIARGNKGSLKAARAWEKINGWSCFIKKFQKMMAL